MNIDDKLNMKDMLAQGLYRVMLAKPFEKITIKQISDETGVIRGTFYNHFVDKYEALQYLLYQVFPRFNQYQNIYTYLKTILHIIYTHQPFFIQCFKIDGQNSFESILEDYFVSLYTYFFKEEQKNMISKQMKIEIFIRYYAHGYVYILREWVQQRFQKNDLEMYEISNKLIESSLKTCLKD